MDPLIRFHRLFSLLILFMLIISLQSLKAVSGNPGIKVIHLQVEYSTTPLGIDVLKPRFGWQLSANEGVRGIEQVAYQIVVNDEKGNKIWDSGKIPDRKSVAIPYGGMELRPCTKYTWTVSVWDLNGKKSLATSWFETGLMNPDIHAWEGADWIGGSAEDMVLYSHYLPLYDLTYAMAIAPGSTKASFIWGANDIRLMDKNKNLFQLQAGKDKSYFKLEMDISGLEDKGDGFARLTLYRMGYAPEDTLGKPVRIFEIKPSILNPSNKNKWHRIGIHGEFGTFNLMLDDSSSYFTGEKDPKNENVMPWMRRDPGSVNLNPMGEGSNYIPFGQLCDIGFSMDPGQRASFSEIKITNTRKPNAVLFYESIPSDYQGVFQKFMIPGAGIKVQDHTYLLDGQTQGGIYIADPSRNASPMLRAGFEVDKKPILKARLYVTSRGIYEYFINGNRVGTDYYNPGLTQYNITHLYQTYDVTSLVNQGPNAMGAMLGEGWWSGLLSFGNVWNHFGDRQSLLAKLVITYRDGSTSSFVTNDRDWKYYNHGPVLYNSLDMGEVYDATREEEIKGWSTAGFDDKSWKSAGRIPLEGTTFSGASRDIFGSAPDFQWKDLKISAQVGENAGVFKMITAQSVREVRPGVFIYNMGQNFVGVPKIMIHHGQKGQQIVLRYSEILYPDLKTSGKNVGMIMTENYRAALCQDIYIMKDGDQVIQPRFTFRGYQYIEITGISQPLPLTDVQGLAISSVKELTAGYESSNSKINQLWSNLTWSNVDNFLTIPTDCPQRNERMGWSGDISVFSRTATYVSQADQFFRRHMMAMRDNQTKAGRFSDVAPVGGGFGGILWGSAGITVPWEAYLQYGDLGLLEEHYQAMDAYMEYLSKSIDSKTGISNDGVLGDWLGPQNNKLGQAFLTTAYHVYDLGIMMKVAALLNKKKDQEKYASWYLERKNFFNNTFVNQEKKTLGLLGGGFGSAENPQFRISDTQTSYAVGLALGVFNDVNTPFMAKALKECVIRENPDDDQQLRPSFSLMTGFIGTAWISKALSDYGYSEIAYRLLQNEQYPSWLYPINQGATSIWERLNGYTVEGGFNGNNSMNSFNHYSFGAIGQWLIAYSLGIQRDEPGFSHFILQPEPDPTRKMTWAKGFYDSPYGRIKSSWEIKGDKIFYIFEVPANTTAWLFLPCKNIEDLKESGSPVAHSKDVKFIRQEGEKAVLELKSGIYKFESDQSILK